MVEPSEQVAPEKPNEQGHVSTEEAQQMLAAEKRLSAWWVLGIVFGLSTVMGVVAFASLKNSVTSIQGSLKQIRTEGKELSPQQCASRVLRWANQCGAMRSLCDASVHRMMGQCLEGQPRKKVCMAMDLKNSKAHFTFAQCKKRELQKSRRWKKICGGIYSALWIHCMYWRKGKLSDAKVGAKAPKRAKPTQAPLRAPVVRRSEPATSR